LKIKSLVKAKQAKGQQSQKKQHNNNPCNEKKTIIILQITPSMKTNNPRRCAYRFLSNGK